MDSGNSGSLQSSSNGGDEEYADSRTESSMSSFLNHSSTHFNPNPHQNPILQPPSSSSSSQHHQTLDTTFFNHSSAPFFTVSSSSENPNLNPVYDHVWSRNIRNDPGFTGFGASRNDDVFMTSDQQGMYPSGPNQSNQSPPVSSNVNSGGRSDHQVGVIKNPKKRTRASRRAPTTVLTTDTTNFRQMVQEFTGIPTAPFSGSGSPYTRRLDLFAGGGGVGSLYPVRPSAVKVQLQQPSSNSVDGSSSNYQIHPSGIQGLQNQPQSLLNSQNPLFSFQSVLQTKPPPEVNRINLGTTKTGNHQSDGFPNSSTSWRDQNENLVTFDGGNCNTPKVDGYRLNSSDFHHQTENVVSSRNGGDQAQGNVDAWLCPSD